MLSFNDYKISVVVQGPITSCTKLCLTSLRYFLPNSEIILSTWEDENVENLSYDKLVMTPDPGIQEVIFRGNIVKSINLNRQIISTKNGLKQCQNKYALKIRSDCFLVGNNFLEYFFRYQKRNRKFRILENRVIVPNHHCVDQTGINSIPFHISDWFHFGLKEDLLKIWDVDLIREPKMSSWFITHKHHKSVKKFAFVKHWCHRYTPEQALMINFLKKFINIKCEYSYDLRDNNKKKSQIIIANNFIVLNLKQIGLSFPKYTNLEKNNIIKYYNYDHNKWLYLYKKYCDNKVKVSYFKLIRRKIIQYFFIYKHIILPNYVVPFLQKLKNK